MTPYPFSYFASLAPVQKAFKNRKVLSWFQMIFTLVFLVSLSLIPSALQTASQESYELTTFIEDVYEPLSNPDALKALQAVGIKDHQLQVTDYAQTFDSLKGSVHLVEKPGTDSQGVNLTFQKKEVVISKKNRQLAHISYRGMTDADLSDQASLVKALNRNWFQENRPAIALFIIGISAGLLTINFLFITFGASVFLYLTRKSRLFSFQTYKECYNFILNILGLPVLFSLFVGLFGAPITTVVLVQNIAFVLYMVYAFFKTHYRDDYEAKKKGS